MVRDNKLSLEHGDGLAKTIDLIRDEIVSRFSNPILDKLEDGSTLNIDNAKIVVSADSFTVDPEFFPGGNIGKLSVTGTVNDLVASGGVPLFMTLSIIVTEGYSIERFRNILNSIRNEIELTGVKIIAGDTKILKKNSNQNNILINTVGIGRMINFNRNYSVSGARPGDKVIITGTVGDHGFSVISAREGLGFEQRVKSDCHSLNGLILPLLYKFEAIHCLRDPTRGGLIGVLLDIVESSGIDLHLNEDAVPVNEETLYGCEMLGIDPKYLVNEGKMVLVVAEDIEDIVISELRLHPLGEKSATIASINKAQRSIGELIIRNDKGEKVVKRPSGIAIPRLC
jgi:hydrogenase expression/formation protein HypE